ncbi:MAG TPA: hypothetical protein VM870_04080, partial [Pyrinomonadaceae bacterium]|nr:hypothetical protein [Pyrinomonadaceae bacterium]
VLPDNSVWWRTSSWRLGAALDANENRDEALAAYIKSYQSGTPDAGRRAVIEALYRKINGSLTGLDEKLGAPSATAPPSKDVSSPPAEGGAAASANQPPASPPGANQP